MLDEGFQRYKKSNREKKMDDESAVMTECRPASEFLTEVRASCESIAPTWPLDQFIAVNPWWEEVGQSIEHIAAKTAVMSETTFLMPAQFYLDAVRDGRISREGLHAASLAFDCSLTPENIQVNLDGIENTFRKLALLAERFEFQTFKKQTVPLKSHVLHQISQYCASYFDVHHATWRLDQSRGLYGGWRHGFIADKSIGLLVGRKDLKIRAKELPQDPNQLIVYAFEKLKIPENLRQIYASALLESVHGWASWCAYSRWQAKLKGSTDSHVSELLAIRLAWEVLLDDQCRGPISAHADFTQDLRRFSDDVIKQTQQNKFYWVCQHALEITYQNTIARDLCNSFHCARQGALPSVQAYFCIDVRSEVFRRALEEQDESVQTAGFAGFFGLPIDFTPFGTTATRPQLPGLLSSLMSVVEYSENALLMASLAERRQARLKSKARWGFFQSQPSSAFTFVESLGAFSLFKLVRNCFPNLKDAQPAASEGLLLGESKRLKPRLVLKGKSTEIPVPNRIELCAKIMRNMFLTQGFARLVLLVGHGSQSANNAHASGLDCGACCGQSGEVNARILALLLNDTTVRDGLREQGIFIPNSTQFLAGLHNTTTDDVTLLDTELLPQSHEPDLARLRGQLEVAAQRSRLERASKLGICVKGKSPKELQKIFKARANNWAEVRPEWGLADNAALIIGPRSRTKGINLKGRAFLHEYNANEDANWGILELIMTAPMIVAHWINMQYYASVVDNRRYGSGDKTLHNVVGGNIGVFEGNGGDLRIGLSHQSLWMGDKLAHTPQRLSVFIEAPCAAISAVIEKHSVVKSLVENGWIFLFQIDPETKSVNQYHKSVWRSFLR